MIVPTEITRMKRRWILWLLVFICVWIVIGRIAEFGKLTATLANGTWEWVILAAVLQLAFYAIYSVIYEVAFDTVQVRSSIKELLPVVFSAVFINVALPTGGASGVALFIDDAARHGQSPARAAAGVLLVLTVDFLAFTILLALGMVVLASSGQLHAYDITAAAILLLLIGGLTVALLLGLWRPHLLLRILHFTQRVVNRAAGWFKRPPLLPEDWAAVHAMDFSAASIAISCEPWKLSRAFIIALFAHGVNLTSLFALFLAFYGPVDVGKVLAGYAIGNLFWIVSITPQGVGVVEGVMTLVYSSLKIPVAKAAVIVLAYRGLGFWLPLIIGSILVRKVRTFTELPPPQPGEHTARHKPPVP